MPFLLGIFTGMRKGEILGLKWSDVDFENGKIHIRRTLGRTKKGLVFKDPKHQNPKDKFQSLPTTKKLIELKMKQEKVKIRLSEAYEDNDIIICTYNGKPKEPRNLLRDFLQDFK
ncbi:tyrosine-type recombinase/integrase [Salipaludibacillus sp. CUR1]|nr:tyrosine-type recombinase/integrase [Salipaludibacillus sp. CUR1]